MFKTLSKSSSGFAVPFFLFLFLFGCTKDKLDTAESGRNDHWKISNVQTKDWNAELQATNLNRPGSRSAKNNYETNLRPVSDIEFELIEEIINNQSIQNSLTLISNNVGNPSWEYALSYPLSVEGFSFHIPLLQNEILRGILIIDKIDNKVSVHAIKGATLEKLASLDVDDNYVHRQLYLLSTYGIYDKVINKDDNYFFEHWMNEALKDFELIDSSSKASFDVYTVWAEYPVYWQTSDGFWDGAFVNEEQTYSSYSPCPAPGPSEIQDPFGLSTADLASNPITLEVTQTSSSEPIESLEAQIYVDLSEYLDEIEEKITDDLVAFPCAKELIERLKAEGFNSEITDLVKDLFDLDTDVNIHFTSKMMAPSLDGETDVTSSFPQSAYGPFELDVEITLNQRWLNSTEDFILATTIHESIHALFFYFRLKASGGYIDQALVDQKFPIWSGDYQNRKLEHEEFAENYLDKIIEVLQNHNPNLSMTEASALAWQGLQDTQVAQKYLQSDNIRGNPIDKIKDINWEASGRSNNGGPNNFKPCGN